MNSVASLWPLSASSKLIYRSVLFVLCSTAPLLFHSVSAQNLNSRPVARLITASSDRAVYSRPRVIISAGPEPDVNIAGAAKSPSVNEATEAERRVFEVTNELRAKNGLTPFAWDRDLGRMARVHAESMARRGFFSHETPEGLRLRDRARAVGIQHFKVLGENIAYNQGFDDPGAFAVQRWMISPGHRANILSTEFCASATGSFVAADGTVYFTEVFISR